jgi:hypothetical protein
MAANQVGNMTNNDGRDDSARAEIEGVKTLLKEAEAENRRLRWLLVVTMGFMVYVVCRFS